MIEFVSSDKSTEVLQPTDGAFDFPSFAIASELSSVLSGSFHTVGFVWRNELCFAFEKAGTQRIAVSSSVVNQSFWSMPNHPALNQRLNQFYFVRTGTGNQVAAGRPMAISQQHDFSSLAAFGLPYTKPPFFAAENVPSAIDSSRSMFPCRSSNCNKRAQAFLKMPDSDHSLSRRQQVGYDGNRLGKSRQRAPVRKIQATASKQARDDARGRPPSGDGSGSSNRSEIKPHCSSVSSKLGSILDPTLASAIAEGDRCNISSFPFANCTYNNSNGLGQFHSFERPSKKI
jgi:hypothetical protein